MFDIPQIFYYLSKSFFLTFNSESSFSKCKISFRYICRYNTNAISQNQPFRIWQFSNLIMLYSAHHLPLLPQPGYLGIDILADPLFLQSYCTLALMNISEEDIWPSAYR